MSNYEKIDQVIRVTSFSDKESLKRAKAELAGIPGEEVIAYLTEESQKWDWSEIFYPAKELEEVFGAKFNLKTLVESFFTAPENYSHYTNKEMIDFFIEKTGRNVTAEEVVRLLDLSFVRKSVEFDVGITGFIYFVLENGGNASEFCKRIIAIADELSDDEIDELVFMGNEISVDHEDALRLYHRINWATVRKEKDYNFFFKKFAPELVAAQ